MKSNAERPCESRQRSRSRVAGNSAISRKRLKTRDRKLCVPILTDGFALAYRGVNRLSCKPAICRHPPTTLCAPCQGVYRIAPAPRWCAGALHRGSFGATHDHRVPAPRLHVVRAMTARTKSFSTNRPSVNDMLCHRSRANLMSSIALRAAWSSYSGVRYIHR